MPNNMPESPSLLDLFSPPEKKIIRKGVFGLICALSADTSFIESILINFTGISAKHRKQVESWRMALFLDPSHGQLEGIPGLAYGHFIPKENQKRKIDLMHAKVALLGFGESAAGDPDLYRLIVFTGNWTTHAVNGEINLVWYCDYDSKKPQKQAAADIYESVSFWRHLLVLDDSGNGYYLLDDKVRERINQFFSGIEDKIEKPGKNSEPRFFSNLLEGNTKEYKYFKKNSMGAQVLTRIGMDQKLRNFICCGSGFFESPKNTPQEPEVLKQIVEELKNIDGLAYKYLVINGPTSGAAGHWLKYSNKEDITWTFYEPLDPANKRASLHAKYIFVAKWKRVKENERYTLGLLYLGSGNLSQQGFALGPGTRGNVEAGVFLEMNEEYLEEKDLCEKLGISDNTIDPDSIQKPESEDTEKGSQKIPSLPPITSCLWNRKDRKLSWKWDQSANDWTNVCLLETPIDIKKSAMILKNGEEPSFTIELKAKQSSTKEDEHWNMIVFTDCGGFYSPPPRRKMPDEIMASLMGFPDVMPEEEDESDDPPDDVKTNEQKKGNVDQSFDHSEERKGLREFPLYVATHLIEIIAQKNQIITEGQMPDWIEHLRRTLLDEMDKETIKKMRSLKLNFLKPLKDVEGFAPNNPTKEYKKLIDDISSEWKLSNNKL